jgi:hypothetical protein
VDDFDMIDQKRSSLRLTERQHVCGIELVAGSVPGEMVSPFTYGLNPGYSTLSTPIHFIYP